MTRIKTGPEYKLKIGDHIIIMNEKKFHLLDSIQKCGSILKASEKYNIPYRSALNYIDKIEEDVNSPVVLTKKGGKGGGGQSKLTSTGELIVREYKKLEAILKLHVDVNEIEGEISDVDIERKVMNIVLNDSKVTLPLRGKFKVGEKALVLISPEDIFIMIKPQESSVRNIFKGIIKGMELKNEMVRLNVDLGEISVFADITEYSREQLDLNLGKEIYIGFKAAAAAVVKL
jgi:molybdate transport system regulatory protein